MFYFHAFAASLNVSVSRKRQRNGRAGRRLPSWSIYLLKSTGIWNSFIYLESISWVLTAERREQGTDPASSLLEASTLGNSRSPAPPTQETEQKSEGVREAWSTQLKTHPVCSEIWRSTSLFPLRYSKGAPQAPVIQNSCSERCLGRGNAEPCFPVGSSQQPHASALVSPLQC